MKLTLQTLRSSSSGNCIRVTCGQETILFDCGFSTQRDCEQALRGIGGGVAGVVVSHSHTDHIGYAALRVLDKRGLSLWAHQRVLEQVWSRETQINWASGPNCEPFASETFSVAGFEIRAIEVPHAPGFPNYGFVVHCGCGQDRRKLLLCTDFFDFQDILPECVDADLIYAESNHDLELLRLFPNYSSRFHLSNPKAGMLLAQAVSQSARPPQAVLLGHLSRQRNREDLAIQTVTQIFQRAGVPMDFSLQTAPRYEPSAVITLE